MKILYFNVIEQHSEWGSEVGVNRALQRMGHETVCIDYRNNRRNLHKILDGMDLNSFDAMFLHRGDRFPLDVVRRFMHVPRVFWASELFSRCWDQDHLVESGLFDHYFVHSLECRDELIRRGWITEEKCGILTGGFDPNLFRPMQLDRVDDILFIGTFNDRREEHATALREAGLKVTVKKRLYGEDYVRAMNEAKLIMNVHMSDNLDCETRLYECMGTGTPVLTEQLSSEAEIFDIAYDKGLRVFKDKGEMVELAKFYLVNEDERYLLGMSGIDEGISKHTWAARAGVVAKVLGKESRKYVRKEARRQVRRAARKVKEND